MINKFLKIEEDYHLLDDVVDGFRYWPYIRRSIYNKITQNQEGDMFHGQSENIRVKDVLSIIKNLTVRSPFRHNKQKDILFITHARRQKINEKYKCIYTDDLIDCYPNNSISGEFIFGLRHFQPIYTSNIMYLDAVDIIPVIKYKILVRRYSSFVSILENKAHEISKLIINELGYNISEKLIRKWLIKRYIWHKEKKKLLTSIINEVNPKVIVEVVSYEVNKMIINEIAKEFNICTVELQHGPIVEGKLAYNYRSKKNYDFLPNKLFVFSQYWKEHCRLPINENDIVVTGFPYSESEMKRYPKKYNDNTVPKIIVLSQPAISESLLMFMLECLKEAELADVQYRLIYKLHPDEYVNSNHVKAMMNDYKSVDVIDSSEYHLYELLSKSDIQIGVYSTAIFEGLSYGLKTWIYPAPGADVRGFMNGLLLDGYAEFVSSSTDFINKLSNWKNIRNTTNDKFFVSSSLNNICNEINKIVDI